MACRRPLKRAVDMCGYYLSRVHYRTACRSEENKHLQQGIQRNIMSSQATDEFTLPFSDMPKLSAMDQLKMYRATLKGEIHTFFEHMSRKYGPLFRYNMGPKHGVNISDPRVIEYFFRSEEQYPLRMTFEQLDLAFEVLENDAKQQDRPKPERGVFEAEGPSWAKQRSAVQKTFMRPQQLSLYATGLNNIAKTFVDDIIHSRDDAGIVEDLNLKLSTWSFEGVFFIMFDRRVAEIDPEFDVQLIFNAMDRLFTGMQKFIFLPPRPAQALNLSIWTDFVKTMQECRSIISDLLSKRKDLEESRPGSSEGLIPTFLRDGLSEMQVVGSVGDMLLASLDTSAHAMQFLLYLLARHPEAQETLRREIQENAPDGNFDPQCLADMKYLKAVVKEAFRVFPTSPVYYRRFARNYSVHGYNVPAETTVVFDVWSMCKNEKLFDDADKFSPERWLKAKEDQSIDPFSYIPFGFGKRSCVGRRVAEMEMNLLLTQILMKYRVSVPDSYEIEHKTRFLLAPAAPIPLSFSPL